MGNYVRVLELVDESSDRRNTLNYNMKDYAIIDYTPEAHAFFVKLSNNFRAMIKNVMEFTKSEEKVINMIGGDQKLLG